MTLPDNVQATKPIPVPTNKTQLRSFIGVINYYTDRWKHRSDNLFLTPQTKITSKKANWKWTENQQKTLKHMKKSISRETLLVSSISVNRF